MGPSPENVEGSRPALLLLHGGCDLQIWSTHEIPVSWERIPQGLGSGSAWGKPEPRIHVPYPQDTMVWQAAAGIQAPPVQKPLWVL